MSSQPARQEPALSDATRARFDREIAKYPADQRQSAVMACLRILQEERGWISQQMEQGISRLEQALAVAGLLVAVPALAALSIAWSFLRFYDYRLEVSGEDLHVSCGLLTRRTATIRSN